ncbi:2-dehydro-3-deoxygalactonokinase [Cognatishimia sp. WU-CL00825]|uniref:2-dehydro-3-deoxygalactonokinase n=1 Tax=Cognatishimia sp. WU-CL00825 TaxID=3127658 RepID=UPI0031065AA2
MNLSKTNQWPIAVFDWGTTNLRAHAVDQGGNILRTITSPSGIKFIEPGTCPARFASIMGQLRESHRCKHAYLVGMIGSALGWHEVPMQPGPMNARQIAQNLSPVQGLPAVIVPGVTAPSIAGLPDMMRGEETQIFGACRIINRESFHLCLPGTHSKWVFLKDGAITNITTAMTGELFELLTNASILKQQVAKELHSVDLQAFKEGLAVAKTGLGAQILAFSTRPRSLVAGKPEGNNAANYLSGILIGSEIHAMCNALKTPVSEIALIAEDSISRLYALAFQEHDIKVRRIDGAHAVAMGAAMLHRNAIQKAK